ncbi:bifunctional 3-(3-hydroxy-phenyl)propionate/3-hydroxycinnamic acid hydroxylase [Amycolatopsis sp. MtRt-6]|uniref:bifunctional 3-(3-hydroxy-phenyl)propionate/3-hydroxycinnamic acid hydroxylase n=1 Tax=Amycolatopsis sp. MtRt-6 TaxID=2792782 RepID=UPI001A8C3A93|nr:bifunctional 3-(3-hydroxy-phenyl)propionate/3-hydroxycinnamic acid hydroxylase [Amycolatopsis sp. MtRt-6]
MREEPNADVIVVGAGPVGMTAAALLAARGVSVIVLEAQAEPVAEPKAISIDDESLRTYQDAGIADRIMRIAVPGTGTVYFGHDGRRLFQASGPAPYRLGFPFKNPFAQPELEQVLRTVLTENPHVDLRFGARVVNVTQDRRRVCAVTEVAGIARSVRARYLIAADGGRSTVRTLLGIDMTGRSYQDNWLVVDTLEDTRTERYAMHHGCPERPHVIVPGLDGRCRYEFALHPGEAEPGPDPGFALIERLLGPHRTIRPDQVQRAVVYRFNAVNADEWRRGNVFLMGDAAHMMPPFAGQGLNSGIRDATNLCWKIAGVLGGTLEQRVLSTYEAERRPHVDATIRVSERLGRVVMTTSKRLATGRDRIIRRMLETDDGRNYLEQMRYRPANTIAAGLMRSGDLGAGTAVAQPRVFDAATSKVRMLDEPAGRGWTTIGVDVPAAGWSDAESVCAMTGARRLHVVVGQTLPTAMANARVLVDVDGGLVREFEPYRGRFLLIRPDRLIAASWTPGDGDDVRAWLGQWIDDKEKKCDSPATTTTTATPASAR